MDAPHADVPATRHSGTVKHSASVLVASEHFDTPQKSFHDDVYVYTYLLFFRLFFFLFFCSEISQFCFCLIQIIVLC